ncbi:efflux RND transporter periplasmic adaptor subunit [Beijerinckia sp. L45]|uniref:efflux RND transporter periplasmic adaptor subunit n=1 Tax=Beijerinckia sp. L45 TaxID=1641855 RepID=UPI001FF0246D|nr:efflux RND transporter periplasmic adaptor subunit [Beijerinckia sp. L45]
MTDISMSPEHPTSDPAARPPRSGRVLLLLAAVAIGAVTVAFFGITDRAKSTEEVGAWANEQAIQNVRLVSPAQAPGMEQIVLPGSVSAFATGTLFARATGYITAWNKDIGASVKKGEVLATISAPDLDQQLAQARAQLVQMQAAVQQAQANADLGVMTNQRTAQLVTQGWSSAQKGDTDRLTSASNNAALAVAKANVMAQQAAVSRLDELAGFKDIRAPFDGIVTARSVDIGDLVNAGGTTGRALFQVSDMHRMRIYVNVPQAFFGQMKPGLEATLQIPGQDKNFKAELVSTSESLAENSRMALIQLQADNADKALWPGAFTSVHFHIPSDPSTLRIPSTALIFGKTGMQVAAVDGNNKVTLKPVTLGHNLGNDVEIKSGIQKADRLIDNPQESTATGDVVQVAQAPAKPEVERTASIADKAH